MVVFIQINVLVVLCILKFIKLFSTLHFPLSFLSGGGGSVNGGSQGGSPKRPAANNTLVCLLFVIWLFS
jgi:hypothetical protein